MNRTIIYTTDNQLCEPLASLCRKLLVHQAGDVPIISVSQEPVDLGTNICMPGIGRSPRSLYQQILAGLKASTTEWVVIAEHDCLYSHEHISFTPPDHEYFWYNDNNWFLQYRNPNHPEFNGMFSRIRRRRVQSQLVCDRLHFIEAVEFLLTILSDPGWFARYPTGRIGEPGCMNLAKSLRLAKHPSVNHLHSRIKDYITGYQARDFKTRIPNVDIRHENNFTGQRRGNWRRFSLDPWGTMEDILAYA